MTNTTTCRYCGDEITPVIIDDNGDVVATTPDNAEMWVNLDEESACAPHGSMVDIDDEDENCDACLLGEGHDHEPEEM